MNEVKHESWENGYVVIDREPNPYQESELVEINPISAAIEANLAIHKMIKLAGER